MNLTRVIRSSACLAALLSAQTAFADVTAQDVWNNWKENLELTGTDGVTIGSEDVSDGQVVVSGIALNLEDSGTTFTADIGTMTFTENGDGTVNVSMEESYPFNIADADGTALSLEITQTGMSIVASGDPDAINYDVTADQYAISSTQLTDEDGNNVGEFRVAMNDITGTYTVTSGDLRDLTYAINVASMDILADLADPVDDFKMLISGKIDGLFVDAKAVLPADLDFETPEDFMTSGFSIAATYGLQGGAYLFDITESGEQGTGTASTGATSVNVAFSPERVTYDVLANAVAFDMSLPEMPFPVSASLSEYGITVDMPLAQTEAPAPYAFGINLTELAINDEIWMMGDPTGQLPHDPVTAKLGISGEMRLLQNLLDEETMAPGTVPGEIYSATLDVLDIRAVGATVGGEGAFTFDNTDMQTIPGFPRPEGSITVNIKGANALIDSLVGMGLLPEDQAMMGRMMMGMFARTVGDDELTSTIEVNDQGHILANGQRIQ